MRVKICGIRSSADALLAAHLGADAIGVLVGQAHPSPDFISAQQAHSILRVLPPFVSGVLVSHASDPEDLLMLIEQVQPTAVQIHSMMRVECVATVRRRHPGLTLLKAVHVNGNEPLAMVRRYADLVDGVVGDSCNDATGQVGGTGLTHDWGLSSDLVEQTKLPFLLAGGLTPENVKEAIAKVRPWGVDVNSGVKGTDGFKSHRRMKEFIDRARDRPHA